MMPWGVMYMQQWKSTAGIERDYVQWQTIIDAALVKEAPDVV